MGGKSGGGSYEVGYGKPPREHRFKKGQPSANPAGRPKKKKSDLRPASSATTGDEVILLLKQEAYRKVWAWEGDRAVSMPAIQAALRSGIMKAMKQDITALRFFHKALQDIESKEREKHSEYVKEMIEYKRKWTREIELAEERGETPPDPLPHPDDIIIDFRTGSVYINGPYTDEQFQDWNEILRRLDDSQKDITELAKEFAETKDPEIRALILEEWKAEQRYFDENNDMMPRRYNRILRNRCYEAGASMPGEQKKFSWPGE